MHRRAIIGGLAGILAGGFAPAAIGSGVLMPIRKILAPTATWSIIGDSYIALTIRDMSAEWDEYFASPPLRLTVIGHNYDRTTNERRPVWGRRPPVRLDP